ncbi:MAG: BrnT family toxin [Candidatus Thiodiazotropha sp. (ex Rostrolucina anterorostrata)]|nr:BrnT family toxin [Candidatus Thiodiazotropha sp. (ex Rostrolucina anterorostrata)]
MGCPYMSRFVFLDVPVYFPLFLWMSQTILLMLSIPDEEHSETEERWITLGQAENSKLLLVVHTYLEISANAANVRIISARPATKQEQRQYEANL